MSYMNKQKSLYCRLSRIFLIVFFSLVAMLIGAKVFQFDTIVIYILEGITLLALLIHRITALIVVLLSKDEKRKRQSVIFFVLWIVFLAFVIFQFVKMVKFYHNI